MRNVSKPLPRRFKLKPPVQAKLRQRDFDLAPKLRPSRPSELSLFTHTFFLTMLTSDLASGSTLSATSRIMSALQTANPFRESAMLWPVVAADVATGLCGEVKLLPELILPSTANHRSNCTQARRGYSKQSAYDRRNLSTSPSCMVAKISFT